MTLVKMKNIITSVVILKLQPLLKRIALYLIVLKRDEYSKIDEELTDRIFCVILFRLS